MSRVLDSRMQQIKRLIEGTICKMQNKADDYYDERNQRIWYRQFKAAYDGSDDVYDYIPSINYDDYVVLNNKLEAADRISYDAFRTLLETPLEFKKWLEEKDIYWDTLLHLRSEKILLTYVERNPYYRMLLGVPPLSTEEKDFVMVNRTKLHPIPAGTNPPADMVPIHELTKAEILKLQSDGLLDTLVAQYPDKEYLKYIDKNISLIEAREAPQFAVLYTPKKREFNVYREMFNNERKVYLKTFSNDWMNSVSDYNESFELTMIKFRAIINFYIFNYSNILSKTSFSKEESEDKFKEFGLSFPSNMPDAYRDSLTFVLNYLNTYKGTNYAISFVASKIFKGLKLYKYWIRKKPKEGRTEEITYPKGSDGALLPPRNNTPSTPSSETTKANESFERRHTNEMTGGRVYDPEILKQLNPTIEEEVYIRRPEDAYDVEFVLRPINSTNVLDFHNAEEGLGNTTSQANRLDTPNDDTNHAKSIGEVLAEYTKSTGNGTSRGKGKELAINYDDMVKMDPRWSDAEDVKHAVFSEDFSYVETKYIAVDNIVNMDNFVAGISQLHRMIIKYREKLQQVNFNYKTTSQTHSFYALWIYFMTMINYAMSKDKKAPIGDSVDWVTHILDWETIKTKPTIRFRWFTVFAQTKLDITMEEFPDPVNNNDDFVKMLQKIERTIGLSKFIEAVLSQARNFEEVDLILDLYYYVKKKAKRPELFNTTGTSSKAFSEYLEEIDPTLAYTFNSITMESSSIDEFMMELDNVASLLTDIVKQQENTVNGGFPDIIEAINSTNMLYGGMAAYLQYIVKLFKAWRVEFVGDGGAVVIMGEFDDMLILVDQFTPTSNIKIRFPRWNITQHHWIEFKDDNNNICDSLVVDDVVIKLTRYGDIKIS